MQSSNIETRNEYGVNAALEAQLRPVLSLDVYDENSNRNKKEDTRCMESEAVKGSGRDDASLPDTTVEKTATITFEEEMKNQAGDDLSVSEECTASIDSLLVDFRCCSPSEHLEDEEDETTDYHLLTEVNVLILNLPGGEHPRDLEPDAEDYSSIWTSSVCDSLCVERRRRARAHNSPVVDEHG